ncbi:MAG: tetratricopeptide repeat protein [Firmicutes bacterium]|nr:tetratricopeptide repeat protein [Bacillota bacterium]
MASPAGKTDFARKNTGNEHNDGSLVQDNLTAIPSEQIETIDSGSLETAAELINILINKNLLTEALGMVDRILEKESKNPVFLLKKASILQEMRRYEEALVIFAALTRKDPDNPRYYYLMGECSKAAGNTKNALKQLRKSIECPRRDIVSLYDEFDARESLAFIYYDQNKHDDALEQVKEIIRKNSRHPIWRLYFKILESKNDLAELENAKLSYKRAKSAEKFYLRADDNLLRGEREKAVEYLRKAIATYPGEPEYHYAIGNIHLESKDFDLSEFYLTRAIEIFPENERYLLALTGCYIGMNKTEAAYETARKGMSVSPGNFLDSYELLCRKLGKSGDFKDILDRIYQKDKGRKFPLLPYRLAIFLKDTNKPDESKKWFELAIKNLKAKITESPSNWENYAWLADAYKETGKLSSALVNYNNAREYINDRQYPLRASILEKKTAEIFTVTGRYDEAIKIYRQLAKKHPEAPEYLRELGINLIRKGSLKRAEAQLEKALGLDERDSLTLYYTSILNCRMQNISRSVKFLINAIAINPGILDTAKREELLEPLFSAGLIDNIIKREELDRKFRNLA